MNEPVIKYRFLFKDCSKTGWIQKVFLYRNYVRRAEGSMDCIILIVGKSVTKEKFSPFHIVTLSCLIDFFKKRGYLVALQIENEELKSFVYEDINLTLYLNIMAPIKLNNMLRSKPHPDAGVDFCLILREAIIKGDVLQIDMTGVDSISTMFMTTSFGAIMSEFGSGKLKKAMVFRNITKVQIEIIVKYVNDYKGCTMWLNKTAAGLFPRRSLTMKTIID